MITSIKIAEYVINNRKSSNISDYELYCYIKNSIEELRKKPIEINCANCKHYTLSKHVEPCYNCVDHSCLQITL